jgi:nucleotide-binding universal stress UspA family protein
MFRKIMIATDGSETSIHAGELAIDFAKLSRATVTSVYVVDISKLAQLPGYTSMPGINDRLMELMFKEADEATAEIKEIALNAGVNFERVVAEGDPSTEILKRSAEDGIDLLVMGGIGRSGLEKFLLGSVAEKVVRHSKVPVMIVTGRKS